MCCTEQAAWLLGSYSTGAFPPDRSYVSGPFQWCLPLQDATAGTQKKPITWMKKSVDLFSWHRDLFCIYGLQRLEESDKDFPGVPVIKNPPSNAQGTGSIPGRGTKIPRALQQLSPSQRAESWPESSQLATGRDGVLRWAPTQARVSKGMNILKTTTTKRQKTFF